ncbi:hypothetical protein [Virgibacillus dokdonensis]|uniref:hypothetical protein n=1 Tax=Virgibacillus dokdonensis TaxID=302167 RepID=UPI0015F28602|nr:hypothetical protein [Virgibacillus dokdonensis]
MKKRKIFMLLFAISISFNVYLVGKSFIVKKLIEPTDEEEIMLSEMVQKTVESEDYKHLAKKEDIIAIQAGVDKFKGGSFPYTLEVSVKQTNRHIYSIVQMINVPRSITADGHILSIKMKTRDYPKQKT